MGSEHFEKITSHSILGFLALQLFNTVLLAPSLVGSLTN
ncbi:hypothetical protein XAP6164_100001 [Xanthomonas phaseoli pv. phaseoli]|nr:hypothetical protein XAP6164_100001 [Xanthomonas phaseoli pv. phaseoli]